MFSIGLTVRSVGDMNYKGVIEEDIVCVPVLLIISICYRKLIYTIVS